MVARIHITRGGSADLARQMERDLQLSPQALAQRRSTGGGQVEQADALVAETMKRMAGVFAGERDTLEAQWDRGDQVDAALSVLLRSLAVVLTGRPPLDRRAAAGRLPSAGVLACVLGGMMFHRIRQYERLAAADTWYRPRAYGDPQPDGTWAGWLVFFPLGQGRAIAPPHHDTTQSTVEGLAYWAAGLTPVYLEGALARALGAAQQPPLIARLEAAEYEALHDAERLETGAEVERTAADLDEAAAQAARSDAEQLRRARLAAEEALAASDAEGATAAATLHEQAARDARAGAAAAARRRHAADAEATSSTRTRRGGGRKR